MGICAGGVFHFQQPGDSQWDLTGSAIYAGNYAIALNKKELGEPVRVIFKVAGYKRYVVKNIDKQATYLDADIFLQPMESDEKSNANIKYIMGDDPFNTMVIKMQ
ncbi:MAG: hypothetical protein NTY88_04650 [Bacteroidetes bacterium]|nr:hypothetical protein [Bacteroidota bacterium]